MSAGKGDKPRPVDKEKYDRNFERIFSKKGEIKFKAMIQSPEGEVAEENDLGSHIEYVYENGAKIVIKKTVIEKWKKNKK